jgi:hypothetical protein
MYIIVVIVMLLLLLLLLLLLVLLLLLLLLLLLFYKCGLLPGQVTTEIPPPEEEDVELNRYVAAVLAAATELASETLSEAKEVRLLGTSSNLGGGLKHSPLKETVALQPLRRLHD